LQHVSSDAVEEAMKNIYYYNRFLLELAFRFSSKIQLTACPEWMTGTKEFDSRGAFSASLEYMPFRNSSDLGFFAILSGPGLLQYQVLPNPNVLWYRHQSTSGTPALKLPQTIPHCLTHLVVKISPIFPSKFKI
jgi:hypothetical protein